MAKCAYLRDSSSIKFDFMNCHFANLVLAQLYKGKEDFNAKLDTINLLFLLSDIKFKFYFF